MKKKSQITNIHITRLRPPTCFTHVSVWIGRGDNNDARLYRRASPQRIAQLAQIVFDTRQEWRIYPSLVGLGWSAQRRRNTKC